MKKTLSSEQGVYIHSSMPHQNNRRIYARVLHHMKRSWIDGHFLFDIDNKTHYTSIGRPLSPFVQKI